MMMVYFMCRLGHRISRFLVKPGAPLRVFSDEINKLVDFVKQIALGKVG